MSNAKGMRLEAICIQTNKNYKTEKVLSCDQVHTPIQIIKSKGNTIIKAFLKGKSQLDFKGTIKGRSFSYDCKETDVRRLPMKNIKPHQIQYMKDQLDFGEVTFLIVAYTKTWDVYICPSHVAILYYERWLLNKGKRGFGSIPLESMLKVEFFHGLINYQDYLANFI